MALPPKRPVAFSEPSARRIQSAVRRVELTPRQYGQRPSRADTWTHGVVRAVVTTAIPSGSFASPSTAGRAQIHHKNAAGAWAASGDPVPVHNDNALSASLPIGRTIKLGWIGGDWWLISASCS